MLNLNGNMLSGNYNNVHGYSKDMQNTQETSNVSRSDVSGSRSVNATLAELNVGDVFSGEIVDINNNDVSIRLSDNSVVNALLKQAFEMNIGQKVTFQVKDKTDEQIFLKPMADKGVSKDLVNKSLTAAGLSLNAKNSAIVSALINAGQPIDRQSIIGYLRLSNQYGIDNIDKLIDMNKHGININSENIEIYGKYAESEHQISHVMNNVYEGAGEYIDELFSGDISRNLEDIKGFADMMNSLSEVLENEDGQEAVLENELGEAGAGENVTEGDAQKGDIIKNGLLNDEELKNGDGFVKPNANGGSDIKADGKNNGVLSRMAQGSMPETAKQAGGSEDKVDRGLNGKLSDASELSQISDSNKLLEEDNEKDIKEKPTLKDLSKQIIDLAEKQLEKDRATSENISGRLLEIKNRLKEIMSDKLKLNIGHLGNDDTKLKEQVDSLYEKLSKTADIMKNAMSQDKGSNLYKGADELKNNLSFMNELNHMEAYVQLPLKMSMNEANGDLYVYNKRRAKKNSDDPLTAFLHLDLENLGATDVNISLKNTDVSVRFTLDNEDSQRLILKHLDELAEKLERKGYKATLHTDYDEKKETENRNALLPITGNDESATSIKRYTFDLRA